MGLQRLGAVQQTNLINNMDTTLIKPGTRWAIMFNGSVKYSYVEAIFEDRVMWCEERWFFPTRMIEPLAGFASGSVIMLPSKRKPWWRRVRDLWSGQGRWA